MPTLHLHYLCFVFVLRQAHFNWVGRGRSRWSSLSEWICSRTMCWEAANPVRRPRDSRRGPRTRKALSIVWQMARRSLVLFRASYVSLLLGLRNATIQAINAKMGHEHFFERMAVLYLSTFWWIRSTLSCCSVWSRMAGQCPSFSHHLGHHLIFWTVYRHQPCLRQCWRHCYRSTSQRLVHYLCDMLSEMPLVVPFPFPLLKSRGSRLTHWWRFNVNIAAWSNVAASSSMERTWQILKSLNKVTEKKLLEYYGKLR